MRREVEENESSCLEVIAYLGEWWGVVGGVVCRKQTNVTGCGPGVGWRGEGVTGSTLAHLRSLWAM